MGDNLRQRKHFLKEWNRVDEFIKNTGRSARLFKVDKDKTAILIIDMQNAFVAPGATLEFPAARGIVYDINKLTRACRDSQIPVIHVLSKYRSKAEFGISNTLVHSSPISDGRQDPMNELMWNADGTKIWPEIEVDAEKDYEIVKCRYSAFISGSSSLERLLRSLDRDNLIVVGLSTHACLSTTAMDAMMLDFQVTVVSDATIGPTDFLHQVPLMMFKMVFGDVVTTAGVLEEIKLLV